MTRRRSRNLGAQDIECIVKILDGWSGDLTWELLISAIFAQLHCMYTRQTLHKHERIKIAFEVRKKNINRSEPPSRGSVQIQKATERIGRLEAENQRLQAENERLLEQFARWAFNTYVHGIEESELNRPLPEIDRRRTPVLVSSVPPRRR